MSRVANYALSIKRCCRPERRNESSGRKPFGACVPCSLRRNSSNSRRRRNHISMIFPLLHLPSLLNVRTQARITNLRNSIPHPRRNLCRPHSHMPSKRLRLRPCYLSHLVLLLRAILLQMSWTSMTHLRWRSTRVFYFSKTITCETNLRFPGRSLRNNDESCIWLPRSSVYITIPSVKVMSGMRLSRASTQKRFVRSNSSSPGCADACTWPTRDNKVTTTLACSACLPHISRQPHPHLAVSLQPCA